MRNSPRDFCMKIQSNPIFHYIYWFCSPTAGFQQILHSISCSYNGSRFSFFHILQKVNSWTIDSTTKWVVRDASATSK